jgi:Helix-turn-helix
MKAKPTTEPSHVIKQRVVGFPERLEAVRRHYGHSIGKARLSTEEFAKKIGLQAARYRRYERGETDPPLTALESIRRMTGISLDWLVCGLNVGAAVVGAPQPDPITVGARLRWARETQEPWLNSCAAVMNVPPDLWTQYENDEVPLPVDVATEFSHRFSVSLDYLYRGALGSVAPPVMAVLLERHPELRTIEPEEPSRVQLSRALRRAARGRQRHAPDAPRAQPARSQSAVAPPAAAECSAPATPASRTDRDRDNGSTPQPDTVGAD